MTVIVSCIRGRTEEYVKITRRDRDEGYIGKVNNMKPNFDLGQSDEVYVSTNSSVREPNKDVKWYSLINLVKRHHLSLYHSDAHPCLTVGLFLFETFHSKKGRGI